MENYRLIALDLDGTLLDPHGKISLENCNALEMAQQQGCIITFCTGRNLVEAQTFNQQLHRSVDWIIGANGAMICKPDGTQQIRYEQLSMEDCRCILDVCQQHATDPCFFTRSEMFHGAAFDAFFQALCVKKGLPQNTKYPNSTFLKTKESWDTLFEHPPQPFLKAILHHTSPTVVDSMIDALAQLDRFELAPSILFGGALKNVEINKKGIHKGGALELLAHHLHIPMEQVMAIGDSDNDIAMLQTSGLGIAMGNASSRIQAVAAVTTAPNTEHGVAAAIEQYVLKKLP